MENNVNLEIKATSIYLHTISILTFKSDSAFRVKLSYESISIEKGVEISRKSGRFVVIESQQDNHKQCVMVSVIGLIDERIVIKDDKYKSILGNHYGMRFYPFISSVLNGLIYCTIKIENVSIVLPDNYRFIFANTFLWQNGNLSELRQSYGDKESIYLFTWDKISPLQTQGQSFCYKLDFNLPVRLNGKSLLRLVIFPVLYWIIALIGITILSISNDNKFLVIGSIATAWLFMLQRWDKSSLPQQNTLLTWLYLLYGAIIAIWGILSSIRSNDLFLFIQDVRNGVYAWLGEGTAVSIDINNFINVVPLMVLFIIISMIVFLTFKLTKYFESKGELPKWLAFPYVKWIINGDKKRTEDANMVNLNNTSNSDKIKNS